MNGCERLEWLSVAEPGRRLTEVTAPKRKKSLNIVYFFPYRYNEMLMKSILIFLMLTFVLFSANARQKKVAGPKEDKKHPPLLFKTRQAALYTDIELSGGYEFSAERNFPFAKIKLIPAEGVFGSFSLSSSAALSVGYSSDDSIVSLGLCVPDICFGYKIYNFLPYFGGGFYQNWYFANERSNNVGFTTTIHSYGYSIYAGLNYSVNDYISIFSEYEIHPHTWMVTTGNSDIEWIFPQQISTGISLNLPWRL